MAVLTLLLGIALGAAVAWLVARSRAAASHAVYAAELRLERERASERAASVEQARAELENAFKALSADALRTNNESFLQLARGQLEQLQQRGAGDLEKRQKEVERIVTPIKESLARVDVQIQAAERAREQAFGAMTQHLTSLAQSQERLRAETGNLTTALRTPHVRGRWGEVQLKNVVEATGMVEHCDFELQSSTRDAEGSLLRPDLVVRLPGGKHVVVDAKVPLAAYLDAYEAQDSAVRAERLADHARQVRDHVTKLAAKAYWRRFDPAPDFVIMFLPDETFLRAAQEHDAALIEDAWRVGVIPASPTNLFTLLRTMAAIWQQETVAQSAREVHELGKELYDRLGTMGKHVAKLGRSLDGAVAAYNDAVGSLESRVLVTARKFESHGIAGELPDAAPVERQPRALQALELTVDGGEPLPDAPRALDAA
jgi:DNA recombination protein RmuC